MKSRLLYIHRRLDYPIVIWIVFLFLHILFTGRVFLWEMTSFLPSFVFFFIPIFLLLKAFFKSEYKYQYILIVFLSFPIALTQSDINFSAFKKAKSDEGITVFNWNTEFWEEDKEDFYNFLKKQDAQVYQLQEFLDLNGEETKKFVRSNEELNDLKENFPEYQVFQNHELITLAKLPVEGVYADFNNAFLRVDMKVDDKIISFYNVHIPVHINTRLSIFSKTYFDDLKLRFDRRGEQFKILETDIKNNDFDYVISGDFNTQKSMGKMNFLFSKTQDSIEVSNTLFPTTWEAAGLKLWRIDYVLASNGVEFINHKNIDPKNLSDHWGQKVELKVKN